MESYISSQIITWDATRYFCPRVSATPARTQAFFLVVVVVRAGVSWGVVEGWGVQAGTRFTASACIKAASLICYYLNILLFTSLRFPDWINTFIFLSGDFYFTHQLLSLLEE